MDISLIASVARNGAIGRDNDLVWRNKADMRHFVATTMGHPFVVGRKTFESFPKRPLKGRHNIVLSRDRQYAVPKGVTLVSDLEAAIDHARGLQAAKLFVLGGAQVYNLALPLATEMVLTHVPASPEADTFFPAWDPAEWDIVDSREEEDVRFVTYRRRTAPFR